MSEKKLETDRYIIRKPEIRKLKLIDKFIQECDTILDFGCGNGLYGQALKKKSKKCIAMDMDATLLKKCNDHHYDQIIETTCPPIPLKDNEINTFFGSEVIEHFPSLPPIIDEVERITSDTIILTMPNFDFAYAYDDPTHILRYCIKSLQFDLNKSQKFEYKVQGLGFEHIPGPQWIKKLNQNILWHFPKLSPTIAVIGTRKK